MSYNVIGVDPGKDGAMALLCDGKLITTSDIPLWNVDGKKCVDPRQLEQDIEELLAMAEAENPSGTSIIVLEKAQVMPRQGGASGFEYGRTNGIIEGVCWNARVPMYYVRPNNWKKRAKLGKDKDDALDRARQMFPHLCDEFRRKRDHDRAEAALIAVYGMPNLVE